MVFFSVSINTLSCSPAAAAKVAKLETGKLDNETVAPKPMLAFGIYDFTILALVMAFLPIPFVFISLLCDGYGFTPKNRKIVEKKITQESKMRVHAHTWEFRKGRGHVSLGSFGSRMYLTNS